VRGGYPAEKPVGISEILIGQSSQPGETVADPFMGSGSVGVAAVKNGRRFIGTDLNPAAVRISSDRLKEYGIGRTPTDLPAADQASLLEMIGSET
jgi:site-specific DNA-methyltransferase (adenine-specific)